MNKTPDLPNTFEVINIMAEDKNKIFKRYNDENFKIYRDELGRLMCKIKNCPARTLNLFNYMHDLWIEEEKIC